MSFSLRRYEPQIASAPIFGIQPALWVEPNAPVPNIPNIGSRCSGGAIIGIAPVEHSNFYTLDAKSRHAGSENNMPV